MSKLERARPSRLQRVRDAVRGYWQGPISSSDPNLREFFGGSTTSTGLAVSEASALTYAAVWSAVNCISGDIAALPLMMYKRSQDGGKEKFTANPLYRLVHDQPNPEMTSIAWRRTVQAHALTWGNGYTEIVRDGAGRPIAFWPITPDRVTPFRRGSEAPLEYRVINRDGADIFIPAGDMIHIPGLGFDGTHGYSVIQKARESIGLGMAAERFGETFFGNGATFGGVIAYPGAKPPELSDKNYRDMLNSQHQGVDKAHKFLALYNGATYTRLGIPPDDAQFLETRKFQIADIARWFNLPPHKLGDLERATHSNIEQQTIDYYTGTLLPWLKAWEQELYLKLVPSLERNIQFFEHTVDGLLRADSQMRADAYSKQFSTAALTPNDIRDGENRNPIAGGNDAFVPLNLIPLELARPYFEAEIEVKKANAKKLLEPPPAPVVPAAPDPGPQREIALLTDARDVARRLAQEAEDARDIARAETAQVRDALNTATTVHAAIAGELATERSERARLDTALADVTQKFVAAEEARTRLDTQQAALAVEREQERQTRQAEFATLESERQRLLASVSDCEGTLETVNQELIAATARAVASEADRTTLAGEKDDAERGRVDAVQTAEHLRQAVDLLTADLASATTALNQVTSERSADLQARVETDGQHERTSRLLQSVTAERDAIAQQVETTTQALSIATARIAEVEGDARAVKDELVHVTALTEAVATELRQQITTLTQQEATTAAALLEARTAIGAMQAERDAAVESMQRLHGDAVETTGQITSLRSTLDRATQAIRGAVVDVASRLILGEAERARKNAGSPTKFATWVDNFYGVREDYCRAALKPVVRAAAAIQGRDVSVDRVLDLIVAAHVSESARQLKSVLLDTDEERLPPALERVLRRWEAERAEALADRLMNETR